ncbi:MAG: dTDP-4-dehydrorhamnose 3,5-epimerase [Chloroflexota bacterium]
MIFTETRLKGAFVVQIKKIEDARGFFARAWCQKDFKAHGLDLHWVQANLAHSKKRGTLRGMHYQAAPYAEAKLMRCVRGAVFDVIIDLRPDSPTFKHWFGIELTADNRTMLYVPEGFAHGYQSLVDDTEVFYPVSQFYTPGAERGVRWNDPAFGIEWPLVNGLILSDKDSNWPDYTL